MDALHNIILYCSFVKTQKNMSDTSISTIAVLSGKALLMVQNKQSEWVNKQKNILSKSRAIQLLLTELSDIRDKNVAPPVK